MTVWTVAHQPPLSVGFSRQEYWSGLPFAPPGDLPDPGIEPRSSGLQADPLSTQPAGKPLGNTTSDFPPLSYECGRAGFQHRLCGPRETRKWQAWPCSLTVRTADSLDPGSHAPAHANELVGRAAFSGCPLFSEDNKTLTHPTNARFNNPKCLQFPYAKQNRPLLPANLKIYTPVFSLRFSTLLPFYHTEAVLVF